MFANFLDKRLVEDASHSSCYPTSCTLFSGIGEKSTPVSHFLRLGCQRIWFMGLRCRTVLKKLSIRRFVAQ